MQNKHNKIQSKNLSDDEQHSEDDSQSFSSIENIGDDKKSFELYNSSQHSRSVYGLLEPFQNLNNNRANERSDHESFRVSPSGTKIFRIGNAQL